MKKIKSLTLHEQYIKSIKRKKLLVLTTQIGLLMLFLLVWELLSAFKIIDSFMTSSPSRIVKMLLSMEAKVILKHTFVTLIECLVGFFISSLLGIIIAIVLWWFETVRRVLEPYIVVLNALPKIALGPLIIIWVGVGYSAIIVMTILICIIVTVMSALNSFMSCDEGKLLLMRSMGATKLQTLFKLVLPYSVPNLISILKINVGLAWVGVIMGEYLVSAAGLGYLIIYGGQVFKLDLVMASTVILCCLAALMYVGVSQIEKWARKLR